MTRNEIIRLSTEAGFNGSDHHAIASMLLQFADLVAQAEREACALIAEQGFKYAKDGYAIADDIRARGEA